MLSASLHDPARASRLAGLIATPLLLLAAMVYTGFNPLLLAEGDTAGTLWRFVADFFPPSTDGAFLHDMLRETATTLAIASSGLALAVLIGLPLALLTSRALDRDTLCGEAPARGWQWLQRLLRGVLIVLRGVPDLVWALLLVRAAGLGSLPAVLALGLAYGGMLGKVYAEILESQPPQAAAALAASGASRLAIFGYALLPQAATELISYSVYRWECAIRASAVMGFVGAGGLGLLLDTSMRMLNGGEVGSLLLLFAALVALTEGVSRVSRAAIHSRAGGAGLAAGTLLLLTLSLLWLWPQWREAPFDVTGLWRFAQEFLRPTLRGDFLVQVGSGVLETLLVSALGSALAFIGGALLALPASNRGPRWLRAPVQLLLNFLRGTPDLLWGALAVLALGLGPAAGVLALAVHTSGVLGRLFAQTLENMPPDAEAALRHSGAGRLACLCYGLLPQALPQWIAYTLYRWENNIRIAAILGLVGAGGLGQQLYLALSLFQLSNAATLILAMLLLSWGVESFSRWLRQKLL
ncbi:phosphonate transport system permease protein [Vogesella indigofera]|uniref:Phosphonate transport system permease protein n=1 Tax=Vogesella indigofera TaxID=45465 RepID=A0A495BDP5_VOGIN|nr:ABC transporter permease subunit [Vogesella indigofera]RKQ57805.1 phosphonate transport system permease protein [Vogesella indigofera]